LLFLRFCLIIKVKRREKGRTNEYRSGRSTTEGRIPKNAFSPFSQNRRSDLDDVRGTWGGTGARFSRFLNVKRSERVCKVIAVSVRSDRRLTTVTTLFSVLAIADGNPTVVGPRANRTAASVIETRDRRQMIIARMARPFTYKIVLSISVPANDPFSSIGNREKLPRGQVHRTARAHARNTFWRDAISGRPTRPITGQHYQARFAASRRPNRFAVTEVSGRPFPPPATNRRGTRAVCHARTVTVGHRFRVYLQHGCTAQQHGWIFDSQSLC